MYFILLICISILSVTIFLILDKDLFEPSTLVCLLFLFAIILSFHLYGYWHLYEYSGKTVLIIILGISAFVLSGLMSKNIVFSVKKNSCVIEKESINGYIHINRVISFCVLVSSLCIFMYFFYYFKSKISSIGSIAEMISSYKSVRLNGESRMPVLLNVCIKVLCSFAHISIFVYINNHFSFHKITSDLWMMIPVICYLIICLMSSNRGDMLILVFNSTIAWYILYKRYHRKDKNTDLKIIYKGIRIVVVVLVIFWLLLFVTHTSDSNDINVDFLTYICSYVSGPLASIDMYIKQGGLECRWFGEETFSALNNNLNTLFHIGTYSNRLLEFRTGYGYSVVNIYTSYRRFYHDFGYMGVIILSFFQGFVSTYFYRHVKREKYDIPVDLSMTIYCFFSYTILYIIIDEMFYSSNISISGFVKLTILIVSYKFFMLNAYVKCKY